ncbi:MAG: hypothetical protein ACRC6T_17660 [Sarcina sp.]
MKKKVILPIIIGIIIATGVGFASYYHNNQKASMLAQENANLKAQVAQKNQEIANNNKAIQINLHIKDGAFDLATKEIAALSNPKEIQSLTKQLNSYKESAQNFNNSISSAISALKQNYDVAAFTKAINSINSNDLINSDSSKLNNIKTALPSLDKLNEVANLVATKDLSKANDIFKTINENSLINSGILTQNDFTKIQNFINSTTNANKQIINIVNQKISELKNKSSQILG